LRTGLLLFEAIDALGQRQARLRVRRNRRYANGGHEGRRCERTSHNVRHQHYFAV
jgi:hypothetical protein